MLEATEITEMTHITEQWVDVADGQLRVRRAGSGTPVLLLAGAFQSGHLWDGVVAEIGTDGGVELVVVDLPLGGHLRPLDDGADLSFVAIAKRVLEALDALGLDQVVVAANDTGGALMQHLMTTSPERFSAVLLTSTDAFDNFIPKYFRFTLPTLRYRLPMWITAQLLRTHWGRTLPTTFGRLITTRLDFAAATALFGPLWNSAGSRRDLRQVLRAIDSNLTVEAAERFDRFTGPVDVAWSADDRIFPDEHATRLADGFPNGRRVADITNSGSLSPQDQPGQVADRLRGLLERL